MYQSRILDFYFGKKKIGVLDIETTGLNPQYSHFILGGLLIFQEDGVRVKQYFAENLQEEKQTLTAFLDEAKKMDILITYNGKHFDIKYLKTRMAELGLSDENLFPYNFDLYLMINGHSSLRKLLPNLKQKTVENFMGLWSSRKDEISGAESVELYKRYLSTKDSDLRDLILLHNRDDILQLSQLLPVLKKVDIHKGFFSLGFPVESLSISKITMEAKELKIWGHQRYPISYSSYGLDDSPCFLDFDRYSKDFYIGLPIIRRSVLGIVDTKSFEKDFSSLSKYETFENGFLVLQQGDHIHYIEINHFVKLLLERVLEVINR
nr:ribonuclease H-like domain-containing protein [Clostridium aminobutyricum]